MSARKPFNEAEGVLVLDLMAGHVATTESIRARGISDPSRVIRQLRELGFPIASNRCPAKRRASVFAYRIPPARYAEARAALDRLEDVQ